MNAPRTGPGVLDLRPFQPSESTAARAAGEVADEDHHDPRARLEALRAEVGEDVAALERAAQPVDALPVLEADDLQGAPVRRLELPHGAVVVHAEAGGEAEPRARDPDQADAG